MLISFQAICFRVAGAVIYDDSADDRLTLCSSCFCGNVAERAISSRQIPHALSDLKKIFFIFCQDMVRTVQWVFKVKS